MSWLYAPLSGNDRWMGIAIIDLIPPGLGIFARWLEVSPAPRRMAWRRLRFLFAGGQVLNALAAAKYLPGFFIPPYGLMALLHGLCLAAQVRAFSALRDAPAAQRCPAGRPAAGFPVVPRKTGRVPGEAVMGRYYHIAVL